MTVTVSLTAAEISALSSQQIADYFFQNQDFIRFVISDASPVSLTLSQVTTLGQNAFTFDRPDLLRLEDTAVNLESMSETDVAHVNALDVNLVIVEDSAPVTLSSSIAVGLGLAGATFSDPSLIDIEITADEIEALDPAAITALDTLGITSITISDADYVSLSLAQINAFADAGITFEEPDLLRFSDSAANISTLETSDVADLSAFGIVSVGVNDGAPIDVNLSAAIAMADAGISLPLADSWQVASTGDTQVNTTTVSNQWKSSVTGLTNGGYVVTWVSPDSFGDGVFLQMFDSDGTAVGSETRINVVETDYQDQTVITALADGGFVVAWKSRNQDGGSDGVFMQVYGGDGNVIVSETQVNTYTTSNQDYPSITRLSEGGFVVAWQSQDQNGGLDGIYLQRFDNDGAAVGTETPVNIHLSDAYGARVAALTEGRYAVTWLSYGQDGSNVGVVMNVFNADGTPASTETIVNTTTTGAQGGCDIAALEDGGFVITWGSYGVDSDGRAVLMQRFDQNGVAVGGETIVNSTMTGEQTQASVTALIGGGFVVVWESPDGDGTGVFMQVYDSDGVALGGEMLVNATTTGEQGTADVAALADGGFIVTWTGVGEGDSRGVFTRTFEKNAAVAISYSETAENLSALSPEDIADLDDLGISVISISDADYVSLSLAQINAFADAGITFDDPSLLRLEDTGAYLSAIDGDDIATLTQFGIDSIWVNESDKAVSLSLSTAAALFDAGISLPKQDSWLADTTQDTEVNSYTSGIQSFPSVTGLSDGGYVVVWAGEGSSDSVGVFFQRYDADGTAVGGETRANATTTAGQLTVDVASLADGGFVVTWVGDQQDGSNQGIFMQRYGSDGVAVGGETQVNSYEDNTQGSAQTTGLATGGFVVTWVSYGQDGDADGIYLQAYDENGDADGVETQVNSFATRFQTDPDVAALAGGGFVITWVSYENPDGDGNGEIYSQFYDADGTAVGAEKRINTMTANSQSDASVAGLEDGGYVVTWTSSGQDGSSGGIYAQRYNAFDVAVGGEVRVNSTTTGNQSESSVTALADGGYVMTWTSVGQVADNDIFLQVYDEAGEAVGEETLVNSYTTIYQTRSDVTALENGGFVVTWTSYGQDGSAHGIYSKTFDRYGAACISITDTAAAIAALDNNEITDLGVMGVSAMMVSNAADVALSLNQIGRFVDAEIAFTNPAQLKLGATGTVVSALDAGEIADMTALGVTRIDVTNNRASLTLSLLDRLDARGIDFATNDTITMTGTEKSLVALKARDLASFDAMGVDKVDITDGPVYVPASFLARLAAAGLTLAEPRDAQTPTAGNNFINGTTRADTIDALAGNDRLFGNAGDDRLTGNDGKDEIEGGAGKDRIVGGKGNDTLTGDGATDTFVFAGTINKDRITDFDTRGSDQDIIDIRTYADIKNFENLIDNHASEAKGNVTLDLGAGNVIILEGTTIATLAEADFLI